MYIQRPVEYIGPYIFGIFSPDMSFVNYGWAHSESVKCLPERTQMHAT